MGRVAMYEAAKAPHKAGCEQQLQKIKELNKVAGDKIASIPRDTWAMYATRDNKVWDQTTSNMSESTNHAIGEQVRAICLLALVVCCHGVLALWAACHALIFWL